MRIAHVLDTLAVGGAERVVLTLCELQKQKGHSVEVHYLFASGPLEAEFVKLGVSIHSAAAGNSRRIIAALYRNFKATKPDVAHFHNATAAIYGSMAALWAGVRGRISTRHGLLAPRGAWQKETKFWLTARLCQRTVAVSSETARNMRAFPLSVSSKISLIVNGTFPPISTPDTDVPFAAEEEGFTFIQVARLNPVKNQTLLLRGFAGAMQQNTRLRLTLVGDGQLRNDLERLANVLRIDSRVVFAGERENVGNWLAAADCFVLTSLTEGTPISLLEALAAGLPCIVTDVGEMPVIVAGSGCGVVIQSGSVQQLTHAMLSMASAAEKARANMRAAALRAYDEQFRPEAMAAQYFDVYEQSLRQ